MPADVAVIAGTRPEAIKLAPVVLALRARGLDVRIVASGQHRHLLDQALTAFGLHADVDLQAMREDQDLPGLTVRLVTVLTEALIADPPRIALVQGDASTALAGALACFYLRIPCAHVEAGLRSGSRHAPWPEEMNRQLTDRLCTHHYPPTEGARRNLESEGIDPCNTRVTGQTGVDSALLVAARLGDEVPQEVASLPRDASNRLVYVTGHRRESFGGGIRDVAVAMLAIVNERPDVRVIMPVHPNPNVAREVARVVGRHERLHCIGPVSYPCSIWLIRHAAAVVTDSGGIQEEAPCFGVPVLVTRSLTERPEGLEAGFLRLVGTRTESVVQNLTAVLGDAGLKGRLEATPNPYGDGTAAPRIAADVVRILRELPGR